MRHKTPAPMRKPAWHLVGLAVMAAATLGPLVLRSEAGAATTPNDPKFPSQWALAKVRAPQAWDVTRGNSAIKIAVLSTGVASTPTDLQGKLAPGYNAISPGGSTQDDFGTYGNGTAAAGIIGAATNNGVDVAGVSWAVAITPVKVCDLTGNCPNAAIASGINWSVSNGARIINVGPALNPSAASPDVGAAVANAVSHGVLVVASAGNYAGYVGYPANLPGVIAVGATDASDIVASFSGRGAQLALVAPGVSVLSLARQGCCIGFTSSEFAAAHVSGALTLLLAAGVPAATAKTAVLQGVQDLGAAGWDSTYGYGRLDICNALAKAGKACPLGSGTATATPTRTSTPSGSTATPTRTSTPSGSTATPTRTPTLSPSTPTKTPVAAAATPTQTHTTLTLDGQLRQSSALSASLQSGAVAPGQQISASVTWQNSAVIDLALYNSANRLVATGTGFRDGANLTFAAGVWDSYRAVIVLVNGQVVNYTLTLSY